MIVKKRRNNRTAGHKWERVCAQLLKAVFPDVVTSRYASREADDKGVDLVNTSKLSFQCKCTKGKLDYHKVLAAVQFGVPVVLHKMLRRGEGAKSTGELLVPEGTFAIMYMDDFINLLKATDNEYSRTALDSLLPKYPYKGKVGKVQRKPSNKPKLVEGQSGGSEGNSPTS